MKKRVILTGLLLVMLLMAGCKGADEAEDAAEAATTAAETSADISLDEAAESHQLYNLGGNFIGVDDDVYFVALTDGAFERTAAWGEFRDNLWSDQMCPLMCYNTVSGETTKVCDTYMCNSLTYYDGHILGHVYGLENYVFDVDLEKKITSTLCEGAIEAIDSKTGDFVVSNDVNGFDVYVGGELKDSVEFDCEFIWNYYFVDGNVIALGNKPVDDDGPDLVSNNLLYQYNLKDKKVTNLGRLFDVEDEFFSYYSLDQVTVKDDRVYISIGAYAGSSGFLKEGYVASAKLGAADSLEFVENVPVEEEDTDYFIESALPEIKYTWTKSGECRQDFEINKLIYCKDDNGKINDIEYGSLFYDYLLEDSTNIMAIEVAEYINGTVFLVLNEQNYLDDPVYGDPIYGWDVFTVYNTVYMAIQKGKESPVIYEYAYEPIVGPVTYVLENPKDGYYLADEGTSTSSKLTLNLISQESDETYANTYWRDKYDLNISDLYDYGQYDVYVEDNFESVEMLGYNLALYNDQGTAYNVDLSEFFYPANIVPEYTHALDVGWCNEATDYHVCDNILYVSMGHPTYKDTMPASSFIIAIDLTDGKLLWKSENQVSNANNFIVRDDTIICAYGFTGEPDYIYTLDRNTGKITSSTPIKTMAETMLIKEDKLYVHCYNMNYVFELK